MLDYCKRLDVALEPFIQVNYNACCTPQGLRRQAAAHPRRQDGLSGRQSPSCSPRPTNQDKLDDAVSKEDKEILLEALRNWGALDQDYAYKAS